jgi:hypothetical protein
MHERRGTEGDRANGRGAEPARTGAVTALGHEPVLGFDVIEVRELTLLEIRPKYTRALDVQARGLVPATPDSRWPCC